MLGFLLGIGADDLGRSPLTDPIWENFVCGVLRTRLDITRPEWSLWFYRDQQNREPDFLVQDRMSGFGYSMPSGQRRYVPARSRHSKTWPSRRNGPGIVETEVAVVGRMEGVHRLGNTRCAVSGFAVADFLPSGG